MSEHALPPEATFAGCPKCDQLMHLNHLEWVTAKDAALSAAESRATLAEERVAELEEALAGLFDQESATTGMIRERWKRAAVALSKPKEA